MTEAHELLTTAEVARITGWSITSINRWTLAGDLPHAHKLPGRTGSYLFDREVIHRRLRMRETAGGIVRDPAA
jgi:predicted DNA-binding transcriptional regulator AlpA